jgi:xanthine dehydrogenase accessory factor
MDFYSRLRASIERRQGVSLVTITNVSHKEQYISDIGQELVGNKLLVWPNGEVLYHFVIPEQAVDAIVKNAAQALEMRSSKAFTFQWEDCVMEYFVEVFPPPLHLIVAGAGHVAKPVVQMGKLIGFNITVICDRPQFATSEQFPWADEVICQPYMDYFGNLKMTADTYILLLTRGHKFDVMILRELLSRPAAYIGMIGSRRRISGVFSQLLKESPEETFDHIFAPVGLDIGAQTPEEIAISILAELLKVKNKKTGESLKHKIGHFIADDKGEDANDRA